MKKALLKKVRYLLILPFFFTAIAAALAQGITVSGKVIDETGLGMPGVTVLLKGTTNVGAATDLDGNYTLSVPDGTGTLVYRFVGYQAQEVPINNRSTINVTLSTDAKRLDEVVVVGYQAVTRRELTSSVSSVGSKQLADIPVSTAGDALAGRLAGVQVTSSEGQPGAEISIRVRGGTSITGDNSPLYIVDGIQVENALNFLSPQEIASIDVLKDAASTSIYGARGANGVVVITTKGGKEMPTQISYNGFAGVRRIVNKLDVLNPYEYALYQYQAHDLRGAEDRVSFRDRYGRFEDLDIYRNMPFVDWQEELFGRHAKSQTHILNLTGGSKTTSFNVNLNHADEEGIMLNSGFTRTLASFKFDHKVTDRLRTGLTTRISRQRIEGVGTSDGQAGNSRLRNAVRFTPYIAPGFEQQILDFDPEEFQRNNLVNPVQLANQEIRYDFRNDLILNGWFSYELIKNLTFKTVAGIAYTNRDNQRYNGPLTSIARINDINNQNPASLNKTAFVEMTDSRAYTITNSNTLQYKTKFADDHNVSLLVGQETWQRRSENESFTVGWIPADLPVDQAFVGLRQSNPPSLIPPAFRPNKSEFEEKLFSLFGNVNYNFREKYRASFSIRRDASSLFAPEERAGIFPSAALAWHIGDEDFMAGTKSWLYDLKLRFSYGSVGNNRINPDQWRTLLSVPQNAGYSFEDGSITPGFEAPVLANRFITWETTISRNLGLDISVLNSRVNLTIDAYRNSTNDLLLEADIPQSSGYTRQIQNVGSTRNSGLEFQLDGMVVDSKDFTWNANFNIAFNRNTIVSLGTNSFGNPNPDYLVGSGWLGNANSFQDFSVAVGQSVGQFYGFVTHPDKFYRVDDFELNDDGTFRMVSGNFVLKPNVPNSSVAALGGRAPMPGDLKLQKLSNDDNMTIRPEADRAIIGRALPKFIGGFNQQLAYKNFDLSLFMNFSYGNQVYNANKIEFTTQYTQRDNNILGLMRDRWMWYDETGQRVTDPQQLAAMNENTQYWTPARGNYFLHSFAIEDGSFLRISNLTLGYSIPESIINRTRIFSKFRIYATVNNLHTFTKYTGFDPEANTRRGGQYGPLTPSVDYAAYPRSRYILGGVNVTF